MLKKIFLLNLLILGCSLFAVAQNEAKQSLNEASLPRTAGAFEKFAPAGWMVETTVSGDLNNDSAADTALVLVQKPNPNANKDIAEERERVLLILFKDAKGEWEQEAIAKSLLPCTGCGGALNAAAAAPDIKITTGVLIYNVLIGSRNSTEMTFRFRYDPKTKKFPLIGYDSKDSDGGTGESTTTSTNYLTGMQITEEFQYNQKLDKNVKISTAKTKVSKPVQYIEKVNYETMMEGN